MFLDEVMQKSPILRKPNAFILKKGAFGPFFMLTWLEPCHLSTLIEFKE